MKLCCSILFVLFSWSVVCAQEIITDENASKRSQKLLEEANESARKGDYQAAMRQTNNILDKEPTFIDALLLRGAIYYDTKDYVAAEVDFEKALSLAPDYRDVAYFQLAIIEWRQNKFSEAVTHFEAYLNTDDDNKRQRALAEEYLEKSRFAAEAFSKKVPFNPVRLSDAVNTNSHEYLPALTADGNTLIFTAVVKGQEDFFLSERVDSAWTERRPLEGVNTVGNEGAQSISADGKFLIFTACHRRDAIRGCDLYFTEQLEGEWQPVQNIGPPVSSTSWESQPSISANRDYLYFASDRPGGEGKKDIWWSKRQEDGTWGAPVNLGATINTPGDDKAPFIHADGKTLYFMSEGHPSLGGFDLFYARKDENGQWGKPVNLGHPINTKGDEGLMIVSLDGKTAYFATDRPIDQEPDLSNKKRPNYDLYAFDLYEEARPGPVTYVRGQVVDALDGSPQAVEVKINDLQLNELFIKRKTDKDGSFLVVLPAGKDYSLHVTKPGYVFYSEHYDLQKATTLDEPFDLTVELQPLRGLPDLATAEKAPIRLNNIFFETASAKLLPASEVELNILYELLKENSDIKIAIHGHTDNVGSDEANMQLSENRAKAVYQYLIDREIQPERLEYQGFGEREPIESNDSAEGRRLNRRTEFIILD